jgi:GT2 family glycosyltransferase
MFGTNKKVYIIILNYNGWKDTIECLESVLKNDYENYQIIVVDNDSPNNSMEYILNWAEGKQEVLYDESSQLKHLSQPHEPKPLEYVYYTRDEALEGGDREKESRLDNPIIMIQAGENGGFSAGNNIGIKYALAKDDFEHIWLLNNDTVIEKDSLSSLVSYASKNDLGISGSALMYYHEPKKVQAYGGHINKFFGTSKHILNKDDIEKKLDYIVGASFLIDKKVIDKIGLLPEEYFLYYEDTDYSFNARKNGFKIGVALDSLVYHKEGGSTGTNKSIQNKSAFSDFESFKSRKIFYKKHMGKEYFLIYLQFMIYALHRLLNMKIKNVIQLWKALLS